MRKGNEQTTQKPIINSISVDHNIHTKMVLPKMAVFDIDETLTDPSKRVRAARRAGYLAGEEYGGKQSYPKGLNAFIEWFDSPERFRSDTPLPEQFNMSIRLYHKATSLLT